MLLLRSKILLLFLVSFIIEKAYSQNNIDVSYFIKELNVKFDKTELKIIERGVEMLKKANQLKEEAISLYNNLDSNERKLGLSENYLKALNKLKESSELCKKGHADIFSVFKNRCDLFWIKMKRVKQYAAGVEKGRYYERQATKKNQMAEQRRSAVQFSDRFDYALRKLNEAEELERLAIRDQGRAMQVYTDYPVEYNYGWEDDVTTEQLKELYKNPAVIEPPEDIFATVDTIGKQKPQKKGELIFKVQIAAHTVPLTDEYLRIIYKGGMKIDMIYEEGWYKYSIGRFKTYEEATKALHECKVKKAFIVPYLDGKKITIKEALEYLENSKK